MCPDNRGVRRWRAALRVRDADAARDESASTQNDGRVVTHHCHRTTLAGAVPAVNGTTTAEAGP